MMASLISLALKLGVSPRFAKAAVFGALALLLIALLGVAKCSYDRALIRKHDLELQAKIERDKAAQAARERAADEERRREQEASEEASRERGREIDEATRNIPDTSPSARQRARACIELRRQAKAQRRAPPAC